MTRIGFIFDEGPGIGLGHRRRMESLAAALTASGAACDLLFGGQQTVDVLVVDSYTRRADHPSVARVAGLVVAVDDCERDLAVDLLVDPCPGADGSQHRQAHRVLAGSRFALLDPAISALPTRSVDEELGALLVTFGGGNDGSRAVAVATELRSALPSGVEVRVAIGPWAMPFDCPDVEVIRAAHGLAPHLASAGMVVTAAGVTLLESLCLGRPTVAVALRANQERQAAGVEAASAAILAVLEEVSEEAIGLAATPERRQQLSVRARVLVDGLGAERVARAVLDLAG